MIIIKSYDGKEDRIEDLSKESCIKKIYDLGRFEYDKVDFIKKTITIRITTENRENKYGEYDYIISNYLKQSCELFSMHKREKTTVNFFGFRETPLYFLDEIHFVGMAFIECIKSVKREEMLECFNKSKNINDSKKESEMIVSDYRRISDFETQPSVKLPIIGKNKRNDTWWFEDQDEMKQEFEVKPTMVELMGCFVKKEHSIYICKENIKSMSELLERRDDWYKRNLNIFIELIVLHEMGHSVFQYVGIEYFEPIMNETRANYFSSFTTHGLYDDKIDYLTKFQPFVYHFPYLSFAYMISKLKFGGKYTKLLEDYYRMVGVLYEK